MSNKPTNNYNEDVNFDKLPDYLFSLSFADLEDILKTMEKDSEANNNND